MTQAATTRLKCNPPIGRRPVLANCRTEELGIDPAYQREIDRKTSQALIRRIAVFWDWTLCQPLVVARRPDGSLWVVDGQHRLAASRLRADVTDLPCVVVDSAGAIEESARFVALNAVRRPLSALDVFRASLASGDEDALSIVATLHRHGLSIAPHSNHTNWKPGALCNVSGLRSGYCRLGPRRFEQAVAMIARAFDGQVMRYGGTIFAGVVGTMFRFGAVLDVVLLTEVLAGGTQSEWMQDFARALADGHVTRRGDAPVYVIRTAYGEAVQAASE